MKDAQEASTKANNAYNTANTLLGDLLSSINNGCNTIRSNADQLYTAFSQPESALKTLEKSIENLQAEISKVENKQNIVTVTVDGVPAFNEKAPYVTVGVAVGNATKQWNVNDFVNKDAELDNILAQIAGGNTVKIGNTTYNCSNNTEFMNAATALNNALANNGTSYAISADEATLKLAKAVADANLAAIQNLYTVLTQSLSRLVDYKAPGADKIKVEANMPSGYDGYYNVDDAENAVNSASTVSDYETANAGMIAFSQAYQTSLEKVKPVYDNYMSWRKLRNALGLSDNRSDYDWNDNYGMNPMLSNMSGDKSSTALRSNAESYVYTVSDATAQPYYLGLLKDINDEIIAEGNTVTAMYKDMDANTDYTALLNEIKAINEKIADVEKACFANQTQYAALASTVDIVSKYAVSVYNYINSNDEVEANRDSYLEKIDDLTAELNAISKDLTNSFKNGAVVADDAADQKNYTGKLDSIKKQLQEIEAGESAGYKQAVINANQAFLDKRGMSYSYLYNKYKEAVDTVNHYRYDIQNANYYAALVGNEKFQEAHYKLQNTYIDLEAFNKTYGPWFDSLTAGSDRSKYVVLSTFIDPNGEDLLPENKPAKMPSADEQKTILATYKTYLADADKLRKEIVTNQDECTTVAYGIATSYFDAKYLGIVNGVQTNGGGKLNYENTRNGLITAGLSDVSTADKGSEVYTALSSEALGNMLLAYTNIQNVYYGKKASSKFTTNTFVNDNKLAKDKLEGTTEYKYILGLSGVADDLDVLNPTAQSGLDDEQFVAGKVNTGVANQWTAFYGDTLKELQGYKEKAAEDGGYGDEETLTKAIANAQSINAEWVTYVVKAATCADNYKKYVEKLLDNEEISKALETGRNYTVDVQKAAAEKTLIGSDAASCLSKVNADLDELIEWSGYHSTQLATISGLEGQIATIVNNIKKDLKDNKVPNVESYKEQFEGKFKDGKLVQNGVAQNIEAAYATIFTEECEYANTMLLAKAKTAYNNAKVSPTCTLTAKDFEDYNKTINGLAESVDNLEGTKLTAENRDELMDQVRELENQYCKVIEALDKAAGTAADRTDLGVATTTYNTLYANDLAEVNRYLDAVNAAADKYGEYSAASTAKYAPQLEALKGQLEALQTEFGKAGIDLIYTIDEFKYKLDEISKEAKAINEKWTSANEQDLLYYTSDQRFAEYDAQLKGLLQDIETAHTQLVENVADATDTEYTRLLNEVNQPEVGLRATLDELKAEHGFVTDYNPVANFDIKATAYVQNTLSTVFKTVQNKNSWTIWNMYVEVFENENITNENEEGWKYDYLHGTELMQELLAARDEMEALKDTPIYTIADPTEADPKNERATTADEAVAGYGSLTAQMNAIMDKVDALKKGELGEKYLKGDVDGDGDLTVADVQKLISIIGEGVEYVPGDSQSETENVNGDNAINIADVTALINKILDKQNSASKIARFGQASGNNSFVCEEIQGVNGMRRFAVSLNNEVAFAAGQLDIVLPAGAYVANVELADRANALDAYVFENNGYTRVLMTSLDNAMIQGNSGTVLYIDVEGNAEVEVENMIFSDANGAAHEVAANSASGVGIMDAVKDGVKAIYNAAGQQLNKLTKGI
ncbi:MAG: hypothetical protein NC131_14045, partial [Roseburia sp.]|nr:hypothetical protein [Roseburia sp.]